MDTKTIVLEDKISCNKSEKEIKTNNNRKSKAPVFYTEIDCYKSTAGEETSGLGELIFTESNELVLPGALFIAEKLINSTAPIKPKTINTDLNVATTDTDPGYNGKRREHVICLFGVGTGGAGTNFDSVLPVKYSERTIKGFIPIRKVPTNSDLSTAEKSKYFMKKTNGGYYEYYLKKFEIDPTIHCVYDEAGNPSVPNNFDEVSGEKVINTYMQFNIKISKDDIREYFKVSGGGISKARVNTLGLFFGYPVTEGGNTEYRGVQLYSKLNFNNEPLDNETKELNIIYRIYIS